MNKKHQFQFDFEEVFSGVIITEYDEDAPIVSVAEDGNIVHALGH